MSKAEELKALEQVYWQQRHGLFSLALAITRCHAAAEDAVHNAFARLADASASLDGNVVPYVFATVRNAAIDEVRRRSCPRGPRKSPSLPAAT